MSDWDIDAAGPARALAASGASAHAEAERLAECAWQSWGHRLPMLRGLSVHDVRGLYVDCLAPELVERPAQHLVCTTSTPHRSTVDRQPATTSTGRR